MGVHPFPIIESTGSVRTSGQQVKIVSIDPASPTLIARFSASEETEYLLVTLWATDVDPAANHDLTLFFAGLSATDDAFPVTIGMKFGPVKVLDGWLVQRGLEIYGIADVTGTILCKCQAVPYIPPT